MINKEESLKEATLKEKSDVKTESTFVRDVNYKARRRLLRDEYLASKKHLKTRARKEIKALAFSLLSQKLWFKKTKESKALYSDDLKTYHELLANYKEQKKNVKNHYKSNLIQAKLDSKIAKFEIQRKNIYIDSQGTPHKPLELDYKTSNTISATNALYKAKLKKETIYLKKLINLDIEKITNRWPKIPSNTIKLLESIYQEFHIHRIEKEIATSITPSTAYILKQQKTATAILEGYILLLAWIDAHIEQGNLKGTDFEKNHSLADVDTLIKRKYNQLINSDEIKQKIINIENEYKIALRRELADNNKSKKRFISQSKQKKQIKTSFCQRLKGELKNVNSNAQIRLAKLLKEHKYVTKQFIPIIKNTLIMIEKNQAIARCCQQDSTSNYDLNLQLKEANENIKGGENTIKELLLVLKQRFDEIERLEELKKRFTTQKKDDLKERIKKMGMVRAQKLGELKQRKNNGLISRTGYKRIKKRINKDYLYEKKLIQLENPFIALPQSIKYYNSLAQSTYKAMNQIRLSSISEARLSTPIHVTREKKFLLTTISVFFPGLPQILVKQYRKGAIMLFSSITILILSWLVVFGVISYQGNGIAGLALGSQTTSANLTASYLIEGIIALMFLLIIISIMLGSIIHTWKMTKSIEAGTRPNDWTRTKVHIAQAGIPYSMGLPAFILTMFIVVIPLVASLFILFTNFDAETKFGISEHPLKYDAGYLKRMFSDEFGQTFVDVLGWTIIWTFGSTTLVIVLGVVMALLVNHKKVKFKGFWRIIYLLPWAIPAFVTILFFKVANDAGGELSYMFSDWFGLKSGALLRETTLVRIWLIFMQGWLGHSYIFLLITSGLQSISKDLYEAAKMDGASPWQQLVRITTPIVIYQVAPLMLGQFAFNFGNFTAIYLYSGGGPYPIDSTLSLGLGQTDILATVTFKLILRPRSKEALASAFTFFGSLIVIVPIAITLLRTRLFRKGRL